VEFSGRTFNTLVLLFVASTLLAVGLGTRGAMLRPGSRRNSTSIHVRPV
jgi:hypothetical protein